MSLLEQLKEVNKNVGKPWTADEVTKLLADVQKKKSHEEIAELHQRTVRGIVGKLRAIAADYYLNNNLRLKEVEKYTGLSRELIYDAISLREETAAKKESVDTPDTDVTPDTAARPDTATTAATPHTPVTPDTAATAATPATPADESTYMEFPLTRERLHTFNRTEANDNICLKYNLNKLLDAINEHLATKSETRFILNLDLLKVELPERLVPRFIEKIKENCINCDIIVDPLVTYVIIDWS